MSRRLTAAITGLVLGAVALVPVALAPTAHAADRTATLVGDLQSEAGCPGDWQPDCRATDLVQQPGTTTFTKDLAVPQGEWNIKVAINHDWAEAYGKDGGSANITFRLAAPATLRFSYDDTTHKVGIAPTDLPGPGPTAADSAIAGDSLRNGLTNERFYFLMADRFANGNTGNDQGGLTGGPLQTGLDPTKMAFYHGGDLKGVVDKLDYIKGLGTTSIWLTPSFKNKPVQGTGDNAGAGYHGYWITDFTQIDPHLGTNDDMKGLIAGAHAKGMKVFFDIITNHTADVISYQQNQYTYISKAAQPYKDANGNAFDDAPIADTPAFPPLNLQSFPYTPVFPTPADATAKSPAWLNDRTMYHNRGDSTFEGENSNYGDFFGLDDLFTERPEVLTGMEDIYKSWVDFGVDGFRIDTVKHVNMAFWEKFSPTILEHAKAAKKPNFFMFGEVFDGNPAFMSQYTTTGKLPATLDFGFQGTALGFASSKPTTNVRNFYAGDDYYTDTDSNAYELPTFLGNHDIGRIGMMLTKAGYSGQDLENRVRLANDLMYLTRGQPITYYGDEQGFTGGNGANENTDQASRQDMFATQTPNYVDDPLVTGGTIGTAAHYDTNAELYQQISGLSKLRAANPALSNGAQVHRYASDQAGIYAFSRIDAKDQVEYLVVANNAATPQSATFSTYSDNMTFKAIYGTNASVKSGKDSRVTVTVPPLSVQVFKANGAVAKSKSAPPVFLTTPAPGGTVGGRAEIGAATPGSGFAQVSLAYRPVGTAGWQKIGTDDNAPFRVFQDVTGIAKGTLVEYRAVLKDANGNLSATSSYAVVGDPVPAGGGGGGVGPVTQPANVSVPGSHNSEMGCPGDWQPDCAQAQLALDPKDQIWKGTYPSIPPANYEYKAAINKSWDENYGAGGVSNGPNISYTAPGTPVSFYYDHGTHYVTSSAQGPIITAPGSYQSELGCGGDWDPSCMRPWLQDPDGDGTFTWSGILSAGNFEFKVAHGLGWDENYGAGGTPNGDNMAVSVPKDGTVLTISYVLATHVATTKLSAAGSAPDLAQQKAIWVSQDLVAWPATAIPAGTDPALLRWRLHWSPTANLAVDAETLGGSSAELTRDAAGLPEAVVSAHPELKGYLALRLDSKTAKQAEEILRGQVAVAMYDTTGSLLDATGVQLPLVLDDLYAGPAAKEKYGALASSNRPTFRVWAPTAQKVTLLTWPAGSPDSDPATAKRTPMNRDGRTGAWDVTTDASARGARYLYEVVVYAPTTRKIETNLVTDPASVALTLNSTRSVAISLDDAAYMPSIWVTNPSPQLKQRVDSTIYELHVRDFSMDDATVPAAHRGSYLAFADDGDGTKHLKALAAAGLNTVHLLPTFDIASIPEHRTQQETPACDLASFPPDSDQQRACVQAVADTDAYNWGYDPLHWSVPEGSYASSNAAADGGRRVEEFRTMVGGLHQDGLRVVLDQVFNHTSASGQAPQSVLDRVVPGYYHRLDAKGAVYTSTCCQNIATEHAMAQKLMVDSVVSWAKNYHVDGFRFDLMGHHSRDTMLAVRSALDALTVRRDGVDGKAVYLYGEGWNFGEVADNALFRQATQGQLGGTGIGTFSDRLRDAVRGGGPFDDPRRQGFGTGEGTDSNGVTFDGYDPVASLKLDTDLLQLGLAGNLKAYQFRSQVTGQPVTGAGVDYKGQPAGYADQPDEVITYVDAHDNETLFDALTYKLPVATSMADRVRMNTLSLSTTALAQTPSFWHAGADLLRSKSLARDSYNSGDWFNRLDWTGVDNGFGHGLPPGGDLPYQKGLLGNAALKPSATDVATASAAAQDLLKLRFSTPLFRLGSADLINAKVGFPVSGTPDAHPGVVVMRIDDTVGPNVDPALKGILVVVNASPTAVTQKVPALAGSALALSPVQASGSDPVVKGTTWDAATGTATVPARTVAVLVQR